MSGIDLAILLGRWMRRIKSRRSGFIPIFIAMVGRSSPMVVDDLGHRGPADRRSIEVDAVPPGRVSAQAAVFDDVAILTVVTSVTREA